MNVIRRWPT